MRLFPSKNTSYPLNPLWWFWLPLSFAVGLIVVDLFLGNRPANRFIYAENGFLETLQYLILFAAVGVGIAGMLRCKGRPWLFTWVLLGTFGSLYIGLEEISYGQHLFKWNTPEYWQMINDQHETNLHNTSRWLDQIPRFFLLVGILTGGILVPYLRRYKPQWLPARFAVIYPEDILFWTAFYMIFSHAAKALHKFEILTVYGRASEVVELFIYYFILLYLIMLRRKLQPVSR